MYGKSYLTKSELRHCYIPKFDKLNNQGCSVLEEQYLLDFIGDKVKYIPQDIRKAYYDLGDNKWAKENDIDSFSLIIEKDVDVENQWRGKFKAAGKSLMVTVRLQEEEDQYM